MSKHICMNIHFTTFITNTVVKATAAGLFSNITLHKTLDFIILLLNTIKYLYYSLARRSSTIFVTRDEYKINYLFKPFIHSSNKRKQAIFLFPPILNPPIQSSIHVIQNKNIIPSMLKFVTNNTSPSFNAQNPWKADNILPVYKQEKNFIGSYKIQHGTPSYSFYGGQVVSHKTTLISKVHSINERRSYSSFSRICNINLNSIRFLRGILNSVPKQFYTILVSRRSSISLILVKPQFIYISKRFTGGKKIIENVIKSGVKEVPNDKSSANPKNSNNNNEQVSSEQTSSNLLPVENIIQEIPPVNINIYGNTKTLPNSSVHNNSDVQGFKKNQQAMKDATTTNVEKYTPTAPKEALPNSSSNVSNNNNAPLNQENTEIPITVNQPPINNPVVPYGAGHAALANLQAQGPEKLIPTGFSPWPTSNTSSKSQVPIPSIEQSSAPQSLHQITPHSSSFSTQGVMQEKFKEEATTAPNAISSSNSESNAFSIEENNLNDIPNIPHRAPLPSSGPNKPGVPNTTSQAISSEILEHTRQNLKLPKTKYGVPGESNIIPETTVDSISNLDLIEECKKRQLLKKTTVPGVSVLNTKGESSFIGDKDYPYTLTSVGHAYLQQDKYSNAVPADMSKVQPLQAFDKNKLRIVAVKDSEGEKPFLRSSKQTHLLVASDEKGDNFYIFGTLTSKKEGDCVEISEQQFKKFQQIQEGKVFTAEEENKSHNKKVQNLRFLDNVEVISKKEVHVILHDEKYINTLNEEVIAEIIRNYKELSEKNYLMFNHEGITKEQLLEICKEYNHEASKENPNFPETEDEKKKKDTHKQQQQAKQILKKQQSNPENKINYGKNKT